MTAPLAPALSEASVWAPSRRLLAAGLVLAVTLVAFESLAVTTILPTIVGQLGDLYLYGWVISAFMLASLLGIVVAGDLVDRVGMVAPMAGGVALFAAGLVVDGLAPSMPLLVAGRVLQGIGAGIVPAVSWAAVARGYPEAARPRMVAVISTAWVVPALVGPALASEVASSVGWRWVFIGLVVPVLLAGAVAARALAGVHRPAEHDTHRPPLLSVLGVVAGAALALAALGAHQDARLIVGVLVGTAVLLTSLRRLTPVGTLTARSGLPATVLTRGLSTASYYAVAAFVPFALTTVRGTTPLTAAVAVSASTVAWTCAAWVQERLIRRWGPRRLVRTGELVLAAGILGMIAVVSTSAPAWLGVLAWTIGGAGMGLAYSPLAVTTMDAAREGDEGHAMAALQLLDLLGQAVGIGAAGAAVAAYPSVAGTTPPTGTAIAFGIGLLVAAGALTVVRRLPNSVTASAPTSPSDTPATSAPPTEPSSSLHPQTGRRRRVSTVPPGDRS